MLSRRGIFSGLAALVAAPVVVRAASLMPVRGIIMPTGVPMMTEVPPTLGQWLEHMSLNFGNGPSSPHR
jgi:hypothetical protein